MKNIRDASRTSGLETAGRRKTDPHELGKGAAGREEIRGWPLQRLFSQIHEINKEQASGRNLPRPFSTQGLASFRG
jgi:hypothetical protein